MSQEKKKKKVYIGLFKKTNHFRFFPDFLMQFLTSILVFTSAHTYSESKKDAFRSSLRLDSNVLEQGSESQPKAAHWKTVGAFQSQFHLFDNKCRLANNNDDDALI